jgi:hypothetical protein
MCHNMQGSRSPCPKLISFPGAPHLFNIFVLLTCSLLNIRAKAELVCGFKSVRLFFRAEKRLNIPNIVVSAYHYGRILNDVDGGAG